MEMDARHRNQLYIGDDMRAVVADPFGNVYLSDISARWCGASRPTASSATLQDWSAARPAFPPQPPAASPRLVSIGKARGVGSDAAGDIFIANYTGNEVFEVKRSTGLLYLVAGTGVAGDTGDGNAATSAEINNPRGAWGDTVGNIYIADTAGNKIRVVDAFGNIHTFAGNGTAGSNGDGAPATSAEINNPQGVIADANLNVYIADSSGGRIRVVCVTCGTNSPLDALLAKLGIASPVNGDIYTVAGSGSTGADSYTAPVLVHRGLDVPAEAGLRPAGNLYISDGNGFIWFLDFHTGYLRAIARNATICASHTDSYGDGCPATQAKFGDGGNGMGVGADALGNIYISDGTNVLIRKVITGLQSPSTATGSTTSQPVEIHFIAGDTRQPRTPCLHSTEWSLGTPACTTNADSTTDCLLTSGFTPAVPGARSTPLTVNSALGNTANLVSLESDWAPGSTLDPATNSALAQISRSLAWPPTPQAMSMYPMPPARRSASLRSRGSHAGRQRAFHDAGNAHRARPGRRRSSRLRLCRRYLHWPDYANLTLGCNFDTGAHAHHSRRPCRRCAEQPLRVGFFRAGRLSNRSNHRSSAHTRHLERLLRPPAWPSILPATCSSPTPAHRPSTASTSRPE
jgi:hypothetical protein